MTRTIGLSMLFCLGEKFSRLCQRLQKVTVDYVELVDDGWHTLNQKRVSKLMKLGEETGLTYTLHAPFANINIAAHSEATRSFVLKRLEKSMIFAKKLECRLMVFHPGLRTGISMFYPGVDWKKNVESVQKLLELGRKHEVEIAVENCPSKYGFLLKNVDQFSRFFGEVGEEVGLVLDVGHSNIDGQTIRLIEAFGEKIAHVHVHDNDGKHDLHLGVGSGTVNWREFAVAVKKTGFEGLVMVESYRSLEKSIQVMRTLLA